VSCIFTARVCTTSQVEGENGVNKTLGGPKRTLLSVFNTLKHCTNQQKGNELIETRQVSHATAPGPTCSHTFASFLVVSTIIRWNQSSNPSSNYLRTTLGHFPFKLPIEKYNGACFIQSMLFSCPTAKNNGYSTCLSTVLSQI
jgi:hypothetical protein